MNTTKFFKHVQRLFDSITSTLEEKNADYSADDRDALKNFRLMEQYGNIVIEAAIMCRVSDKFARLCNLLTKPAAVKDESFEDTIKDLIGYLAILHAARAERKTS